MASVSYSKEVLKAGSWAVGGLMGKDLKTPFIAALGLNETFPALVSAAKEGGILSPKALGALTKGIILGADFAGGALSLALGIKGIIDTAKAGGNAGQYLENISYTLSGAAEGVSIFV